MTPDIERLWSVDDVARFLGVSRATIYRLGIRSSKVGRSRRYSPDDVRQFVELNANRPPIAKPAA